MISKGAGKIQRAGKCERLRGTCAGAVRQTGNAEEAGEGEPALPIIGMETQASICQRVAQAAGFGLCYILTRTWWQQMIACSGSIPDVGASKANPIKRRV